MRSRKTKVDALSPVAPGRLTTAEAAHDKAYREGWMQAWREWSACIIGETAFHKPKMSVQDYVRMERRRQDMESYGKHT